MQRNPWELLIPLLQELYEWEFREKKSKWNKFFNS